MSFGKNKILYLLIILSSFAIIFSYENSPKYNNKLINFLKFSDNKFIAHGGGGIKITNTQIQLSQLTKVLMMVLN